MSAFPRTGRLQRASGPTYLCLKFYESTIQATSSFLNPDNCVNSRKVYISNLNRVIGKSQMQFHARLSLYSVVYNPSSLWAITNGKETNESAWNRSGKVTTWKPNLAYRSVFCYFMTLCSKIFTPKSKFLPNGNLDFWNFQNWILRIP